MTIVALVPAAGLGVRLGETKPKAFVELAGKTMLEWALDGLVSSGALSRVVAIVPESMIDFTRSFVADGIDVVAGSSERTDSVRIGLAWGTDADVILVHDAARALTPSSLISRVVAEVIAGHPAVIPALPVTDTIKSVDLSGAVTGTPDRSSLRAIQTPQGFDAALLRRAYAAAPHAATDDAGLVELLGEQVHTIVGDPLAFKITTQLDLRLARALIDELDPR